jgi:hypothetical protein
VGQAAPLASAPPGAFVPAADPAKLRIPVRYRGVTPREFPGVRLDLGRRRSVFVHGRPGEGKSRVAALLALEWGATWETAAGLVSRVRSAHRSSAEESEALIVGELAGRSVLVLDGIEILGLCSYGIGAIIALLTERVRRGRVTVVTCHGEGPDLARIEAQLASGLAGFEGLRVDGPQPVVRR